VKESVHNAVRHAKATEVVFAVLLRDEYLHLSIQDDGTGFDVAAAKAGYGLINLHERLTSLGGRCEIQSKPGSGTTVSFALPVAPRFLYDSYCCR
jgi:two-component system, NarL family, sensor kinase